MRLLFTLGRIPVLSRRRSWYYANSKRCRRSVRGSADHIARSRAAGDKTKSTPQRDQTAAVLPRDVATTLLIGLVASLVADFVPSTALVARFSTLVSWYNISEGLSKLVVDGLDRVGSEYATCVSDNDD